MMVLLVFWLAAANALAAPSAVVAGKVVDAETGSVVPATVSIRTSDGTVVTDHPNFRDGFRSDGSFEKSVPPGDTTVTVSRGFDYTAVRTTLELRAGERRELTFRLERRSPLRREGWYVGDNHVHMIHGERKIPVDFAQLALAARAEGLDYLSVAQHWALERETPEELERACRAVSTRDFRLTWNLEAPKNYFRGDASKCLGHGWTVAMRGRTVDGRDAIRELLNLSAHDYESEKEPAPNFESHALIHSLGGIVSYTHPCRWWWGKWGGTGIYPVEERKFVSNMAAELPYDTIAGPTYDTIDVLMPPHEKAANECAEKLWFMLLDRGYRLPATGSSDATFDNPGRGVPGRVRVYTQLRGEFSIAGAAEAIRAGRSFVTTGPLLALEIDGHLPGDVVPLSASRSLKVRIRAWSSGAMRDPLRAVELIRNGKVVRTFEIHDGRTDFEAAFAVEEGERAWYVARCLGSDDSQIAITNPVYFAPPGSVVPEPAIARVSGVVRDGETGEPLAGVCEVVRMVGRQVVKESEHNFTNGAFALEVPATSRLRVRVPGYAPMMKSVFLDHARVRELTFGLRAGQLTDWSTYENVRELLRHVPLEFRLHKAAGASRTTPDRLGR
jgi:hypothetical protein